MKNNILRLFSFLLLTTFLACKNEPKTAEKDNQNGLTIGQLIRIDRNMKLRNAPDTTASINSDTMLTEGNFVAYLGEKTEQLYEVKWKDGTKKDYWYRVKTHKNLVGWVYGGGLSFPNLDKRGSILAKLSNKIAEANKNLKIMKGCEAYKQFPQIAMQNIRAEDSEYLGITIDKRYIENEGDAAFYVTAFPLPNPHHFVLILDYRDYLDGIEAFVYNDEGKILSKNKIAFCDGDAGESWETDWEMISPTQWKRHTRNSYQDIGDDTKPVTETEYEEIETIITIDEKGIINEKKISEKKYIEKI